MSAQKHRPHLKGDKLELILEPNMSDPETQISSPKSSYSRMLTVLMTVYISNRTKHVISRDCFQINWQKHWIEGLKWSQQKSLPIEEK